MRARSPLIVIICWVAAILALPPWAASGSASDRELVKVMQAAQTALGDGRAAEAEKMYREISAQHPGFAEARAGLARALAAQGRANEALVILLEVGQGLVHAGEHESGRDYLSEAVAVAPKSAAAHAALGHALLLTRDNAAALEHLRRAQALGERSPAIYLVLGAALWENKQLEQSEATYREVLRLTGRSVPALQALGSLLLWEGRFDEAVPFIREALEHVPSSAQTRMDLARALDGAEKLPEAIAAYRELLRVAPDQHKAHYNLALLYRRQGDMEKAQREMAAFQKAHAAAQERTYREQTEKAQREYGWELIRAGQPAEAARQFRSLGDNTETLSGLASALSAGGDHAGAAEALERAVLHSPERRDLRLRLAREQLASEAGR
jgi:Flp pilus assembly protein TadD